MALNKFYCLFITFTLPSNVFTIKFNIDSVSDVPALLKEGKHQLDILTARSISPSYGTCWSKAVAKMQVSCRALTQELQRNLALALTDCFLQMSGQGTLSCDHLDCLKHLTDRQFNAYTEFFTHTQNICYFLQSKLWHEESEKTIEKLSSTAFKVSLQLALAEKSQDVLLKQQRDSITLQENMFEHMSTSKDTITSMMTEMRESADAQQIALGSLFAKLASLQSWAVGEISWFDSIIFYVSCTLIFCFFTSTTRTHQARLPLLIILTFNYGLERYFCSFFSEHDSVVDLTSNLNVWIWFMRKTTVVLCFIVLIGVGATFRDYNICNYQMLQLIMKQNDEIRRLLRLRQYDVVDNGMACYKAKNVLVNACNKVRELSIVRECTPVRSENLNLVHERTPDGDCQDSTVLCKQNGTRHNLFETITESSKQSVRRSTRLQKPRGEIT